jgi:hypothetical protein
VPELPANVDPPKPVPWVEGTQGAARGLLHIESAAVLVVPMAAYIAAPARFAETVTNEMRDTDYCYPQIEIVLSSHNELELDDEMLTVWLLAMFISPLVLDASSASFRLEGSTLIVKPHNEGMKRLQTLCAFKGNNLPYYNLRLYLNGVPVQGSDMPLKLRYLDVAKLVEEASADPAAEKKRISRAFGEPGFYGDQGYTGGRPIKPKRRKR